MTKKIKQSKEKKPDTTTSKKAPGEKLILWEAVDGYPLQNWIIMGALSKAGLLEEYKYQKANFEKVELKPSITVEELNKIITEFLGE